MSGQSREPGRTVISRALAVLNTFDATNPQLTLSAIARRADMPVATVHRVVHELTDAGMLEHMSDGHYRIGRKVWQLGLLAAVHADLRDLALPYMEEVFAHTRENVDLAILENNAALVVERIRGRSSVALSTRAGGKLPLHNTGVGKALLAYAPTEVVDNVLQNLRRDTQYSVLTPAGLLRELDVIRRRGFATSAQERKLGTSGVAVPILVDGTVVAALGVVCRNPKPNVQRLVPALQVAAGSIARSLSARL